MDEQIKPLPGFDDLLAARARGANGTNRPVVCVQGLGFVGAAMATAIADARDADGVPRYDVVGVERTTAAGEARAKALNLGHFPFSSTDSALATALARAAARGNLVATTDPSVYALADVTVVDVAIDLTDHDGMPSVDFETLRDAVEPLARNMPAGALVLVETTVPPGTCEQVIAPVLGRALAARGLPSDALHLAYAYERVTPGPDYLQSIVHAPRVYAGATPEAADRCATFLSSIINVDDHPLTRLPSLTACETAKVLENAYRAVNIAFIQEWGRFAEGVGVDLHAVIDAIRCRPTHANIRQPGFGVGGYCLTKDPLFGKVAAREIFGLAEARFPFSTQALAINRQMPLANLERMAALAGGELKGRRILLLGVTYRQDIGDTRHSPAATFVTAARACGAEVVCHDPMIRYWPELEMDLPVALPTPRGDDIVVLTLPHQDYRELDVTDWLGETRPLIFDVNNVLSDQQRRELRGHGCRVESAGRGTGL